MHYKEFYVIIPMYFLIRGNTMKFDMHCHTKEGSPDSRIPVLEYAHILKDKGFDGMLITDHDSYDGFRAWKHEFRDKGPEKFYVLKGIEYDTIDAGHFLVIMPNNVTLKILELRGLPFFILADLVHKNGGILGPAHPFGEKFLSIFNTGHFRYMHNISKHFDFLEGFNACEEMENNIAAMQVAEEYDLPTFGGSDAHKFESIGLGYTEFPEGIRIRTNDDLIDYIKRDGHPECGGERFFGTTKDKLGRLNKVLVHSFWFYNKGLGLAKSRKRKNELKTAFDKNEEM